MLLIAISIVSRFQGDGSRSTRMQYHVIFYIYFKKQWTGDESAKTILDVNDNY